MIGYLLKTKFRHLQAVIKRRDWAKIIVALAFLALGAGIMVAVYLMFNRWFAYLESQEYFGTALTFYVLEVFFLIVFLLLAFSAVISCVLFFFRSRETEYLACAPLEWRRIFSYNFLLTSFSSLWPLVLLAFPALVALTQNLKVGGSGFLFYLLLVVVFGFITVGLGIVVAFGWQRFLSSVPRFLKIALIVLLGGVILFGAYKTAFPPDIEKFFAIKDLEKLEVSVSRIQHRFRFWLPSHFLVKSFSNFAFGRKAWIPFSALLALAFGISLLLKRLGRWYSGLWSGAQEGRFVAGSKAPGAHPPSFRASNSYWILLEKEARLFARNFNDLSRALFLVVLLVFYLLGINYLARYASMEALSRFRPFLLALNVAILGYFTVTICLRYVFPSFSMEGGSADFLFVTPVSHWRLFGIKLLFWAAICEVVMMSLGAFTFLAMGFGGALFGYGMVACFLMVFFSVLLALLLGAYFADFSASSADQYTTTPAGLAFTIIGFVYVFGAGIALYSVGRVFFSQHYIDALNITLFLGGTLACLSLISALVPRALKRLQT